MNILDIVRAAEPNATEEFADFIGWGRAAIPFVKGTAKLIYKAASRYVRATNNGNTLCEFCDNLAVNKYLCDRCFTALSKDRNDEQKTIR